jgi:hypothetical protein
MTGLNDLQRAQAVVELGVVEVGIAALGYETAITEGSGETVPELVVELGADEQDRPRRLHMSYVPTEGGMEHVSLLQFHAPLPFPTPSEKLGELRTAVAIVNEHIGLGRFGMHNDGGLYFNYVLAAPRFTMTDDDMIGELVQFVDFHQEHFGDYLEGVAEDEVSVLVLDRIIGSED